MTLDDATNCPRLLEGLDVEYARDADLSELTWYRVGGKAELLVWPRSVEALSELMKRAEAEGVAVYILGKGANLLVLEGVLKGVVVKLDSKVFGGIEVEGETVNVGAGTDLAKLINTMAKEGLGGLDVLAGIPATVGGAIRMNAGGAYGEIGSYVESVRVMDEGGVVRDLGKDEVTFSYRHSSIEEPLVVGATFGLKSEDPELVRGRVMEVFEYKKSTQPLADKSAGCAFKNPPKDVSEKGAGQLIDEAGLKNFEIGSAGVSDRHANFIVVEPGGAAKDVFAVMNHVQSVVAEKTGIELVREVVVWGNELA